MEAMVRGLPNESKFIEFMKEAIVEEMAGGMGSLRFVILSEEKRGLGLQLREASFADEDGVPVLATINLDQNGDMFELDIFRADYSPLKKWPSPRQLTVRSINMRSGCVH